MSFRASDWTILGETSVRNVSLYEDVDLPLDGSSFFAASVFGGPIAIGHASGSNRCLIDVFSSNGTRYATIDEVTNIHSIHWTKCQKLIVVQLNGRVLIYSALGILLSTISMDQETQELGVAQAKPFTNSNTTGLAILNNAHYIFAVNSVNEPVIWRIRRNRNEAPTCWTVISMPGHPTRVIICVKNQFFCGIQSSIAEHKTFDWTIPESQYTAAEPNYDHSFIALLNSNRYIQIVSSDLESEIYKLNVSNQLWDNSISWCGNYVLALRDSPNSLQLYSMSSNTYKFSYKSKVYTGIEPDGIKTFTRDGVQLITIVPEDVQHVLGVASTHPGAFLYEASLKLIERSHLVYECIKLIGDRMQEAIDQCLMCAAHHFDVSVQKSALRAANIGKAYFTRYDTSAYVKIVQTLRILNEVRRLGIPISYAQLNELKREALIDRLIELRHWPMAIKICDYLEIPLDDGVYKVLGHWATHLMESYDQEKNKSKTPPSAELIAEKLFKKLEQYPGISYADIAEAAEKKKLEQLSVILLDREPNIERQVSMLLKLKKTKEALEKATQSHQPNLLQIVISHLKETRSKAEVDMILSKIPQALRLYQGYIREEAPDRALATYKQQDDFVRQALHYMDAAQGDKNAFGTDVENWSNAEKSFTNMKEPALAQLVGFCIQLLKENIQREEKEHIPFTDKNLRATFIWCVRNGDLSTAENLKKHYKLTDKQFWYWTIEAFASGKKWHHFEQFGRAKKSPIGYLPFIEASMKYENRDMAAKFMDKIVIYEEQVKANLIRGNVIAAATLAAEKKMWLY